jgi:hypothetical protein
MSASRFIEIEGALFLARGGAASPGAAEGTCASAAACPFQLNEDRRPVALFEARLRENECINAAAFGG